jgi:hypothetical protein
MEQCYPLTTLTKVRSAYAPMSYALHALGIATNDVTTMRRITMDDLSSESQLVDISSFKAENHHASFCHGYELCQDYAPLCGVDSSR